MSKRDTKDLGRFLKPFSPGTRRLALALRSFVWDLYPEANELIYDNYNAVAFGWSTSDRVGHIFASVAVGRSTENVHFGFYWGSKIADARKILLGEGSQYRYILVTSMKEFPAAYMTSLMKQSYRYSLSRMTGPQAPFRGKTIVKSVSAAKRPKAGASRKPAAGRAKRPRR